jgi:hypothetical protein
MKAESLLRWSPDTHAACPDERTPPFEPPKSAASRRLARKIHEELAGADQAVEIV